MKAEERGLGMAARQHGAMVGHGGGGGLWWPFGSPDRSGEEQQESPLMGTRQMPAPSGWAKLHGEHLTSIQHALLTEAHAHASLLSSPALKRRWNSMTACSCSRVSMEPGRSLRISRMASLPLIFCVFTR